VNALLAAPLDRLVLSAFLVFSRIGTCLMLMPGISSDRIPLQVRLFLALASSLVLLPVVEGRVLPATVGASDAAYLMLIGSEILVGGLIGMLGRIYFWALQFVAAAVSSMLGFGGMASVGIMGSDQETPFADLINMSALFLFFVSDLHLQVIRALAGSYRAIPLGLGFGPARALVNITDTLSDAFLATLRVGGPFIVYGVVVNVAIGLINKLTPQIPVYFISLPFVLAGGLALAYMVVPDFLHLFNDELASFLRSI
jgi:flagellar biosynthesis protein FliR